MFRHGGHHMDRRRQDLHRACRAYHQSRGDGSGHRQHATDDRQRNVFVQQRHRQYHHIKLRGKMFRRGGHDMDGGGEDLYRAYRAHDQSRGERNVNGCNRADDGDENLHLHERGCRTIRDADLRSELRGEPDGKLVVELFGTVWCCSCQRRKPHHQQHRLRLRWNPHDYLQ